jgi:hypothetical protein
MIPSPKIPPASEPASRSPVEVPGLHLDFRVGDVGGDGVLDFHIFNGDSTKVVNLKGDMVFDDLLDTVPDGDGGPNFDFLRLVALEETPSGSRLISNEHIDHADFLGMLILSNKLMVFDLDNFNVDIVSAPPLLDILDFNELGLFELSVSRWLLEHRLLNI